MPIPSLVLRVIVFSVPNGVAGTVSNLGLSDVGDTKNALLERLRERVRVLRGFTAEEAAAIEFEVIEK